MTEQYRTIKLKETASTNTDAEKYAAENASAEAVLFTAEKQTAGRGRQGKSFYSPRGGLYMSLLLPADFIMQEGLALTAAVSVAVCEVLKALGVQTGIKWVNDIYFQKKKLCGILCERVWDCLKRERYIVGIGMNMKTEGIALPEELRDKITALPLDIESLELVERLTDKILLILRDGLDNPLLYQKYKELSLVLHKRIIFREKGIEQSAQVLDINADGSLEVMTKAGTETLSGGEISLLML